MPCIRALENDSSGNCTTRKSVQTIAPAWSTWRRLREWFFKPIACARNQSRGKNPLPKDSLSLCVPQDRVPIFGCFPHWPSLSFNYIGLPFTSRESSTLAMAIKIFVSVELQRWPRKGLPLGFLTRVTTHICRRYQRLRSSSSSTPGLLDGSQDLTSNLEASKAAEAEDCCSGQPPPPPYHANPVLPAQKSRIVTLRLSPDLLARFPSDAKQPWSESITSDQRPSTGNEEVLLGEHYIQCCTSALCHEARTAPNSQDHLCRKKVHYGSQNPNEPLALGTF